jgi:hypothetical protein
VNVTHSGATEYRAAGCGKNAAYVCPHASMSVTDVRSCAVEDGWPARFPADHYRPTLPPPDPRVQMP